MKILLTHPDFQDPGGVTAYIRKLRNHFTLPVGHCIIGKRPGQKLNVLLMPFRMLLDYYHFWKMLDRGNYDVVQINPSLNLKSFLRDGIFVLLAKMRGKKTVVFFHGWSAGLEQRITRSGKWLFRRLYGKADRFIVLANAFKNALISWGISPEIIHCEVMPIEDKVSQIFDIEEVVEKRKRAPVWRILFLARMVKEKGIYETIQAFDALRKKYDHIELLVAGDGPELAAVQTYAKEKDIPGITFCGYIQGTDKQKLLLESHLLCFPTNHGEGFPNTIVEAMTFGLPVVTRRIGGIDDFFENRVHGFATLDKSPTVFADCMEELLLNQELWKKISASNHRYALDHFLVSGAVGRLEHIYRLALRQKLPQAVSD